MNKTTKIVLLVIIVVFILGMALYPSIKKQIEKGDEVVPTTAPAPGSSQSKALNVNARIVRPETVTDQIRITGNLIPDEEVALSFETSGKITDIFFQEGSRVKKGELLAKVNDRPLQAELQKLKAQVPLAEDRVFRQKSLLELDAVSKEAYEQVSTELEKLHADIALVEARIAQTELRAPFDGTIGLRFVSEGAYATPSTMVAVLTKTIPMKLEFSVSERYAGSVRAGTQITFTLPNDLNTYGAQVYAVETGVTLSTRTMKVRARYPNYQDKLIPNSTATILIKLHEVEDALTVPNQAVIKEMGRDIAYLYKNGKAQLVELTLITDLRTESVTPVAEGLQVGDTLITTGVMQLRDGLPVKLEQIVE